jgi:hypothetical protein
VEVILGELPELDLPAAGFKVIAFFHVLEHLTARRSTCERPAGSWPTMASWW